LIHKSYKEGAVSLSTILSPFMGIIEQVLDKVLPSDMDKATTEKIKAEAKAQIAQTAMAEEGEFRKFILQYEGRASDLGPWMAGFRASLRPVISYLVYGTVIYLALTGQAIQQGMWNLVLIITAFWFGERAIRNIAPAIKDLRSK